MPVYRITTRDGRQFDVTLREGVTPEQVLPELESMVASMPAPRAAEQERAPSTEDVNIFRDIPGAVISGVGSLVGLPAQAYGLATGDFDTFLGDISAGITKFGEEVKSPGLRERERLAGEKIEAAAGQGFGTEVGTALETYLSDPRLLLSGVAEAAPSLIGSLGAGTLAKAGIRGLARAGGRELAEESARRAAVSGAVGFGAAQQGADVGAQTYISAMETPDEVWNRNPDYIDRISAGEDPNTVKQDMALSAARQAAGISGGISLATAGLMPGVEKVILGKGLTGGLLKRAGKGFLTEGGQETLEEGGGQFAENVGMRTVDPTRDLTQGVAGAGTVGGLIGGFMGAPVGALNRAPDEGMLPGGPGGAAVPPPPAAPVTPPGAELLGLLGQEGGTIRLREGDTEVPYVFRGIDDTGRILLEGGDGVLFAEDPADIADALVPPATAPGVPPAPPAPPTPPAPPPVATPPSPPVVPTPPVTPPPAPTPPPVAPTPPPPVPTPPPVAPTPPAGIPTPPPPVQPGVPGPQPGVPPVPTPPVAPPAPIPGAPPIPTPAPPAPAPGVPPTPAPTPAPPQPLPGIPSPPAPAPTPPLPGAPKPAVPKTPESNAIAATPTEELASIMRGFDANQAIEYLARNATTDVDRQIATRVSNMLKFLQQSGYSFNFGVYGPKNMGKSPEIKKFVKESLMSEEGTMGVSRGRGVRRSKKTGAYGFGRGLIGVRDMDNAYPGTSEQTILHEYIHAVSQAVIAQYEQGRIPKNSRVGQAVQDLIDLSIEVRQHKNQILADIKAGKPVDPELAAAVKRLQNTNAFADAHELIAQGLSNYDMQLLLKSLPYKGTNGFVEFIKKIGQMLGITEKDENALRRLIEVSEVIIPSDFTGKKDVALAAMRPYDYAAKVAQGVPSSVSPAQAQPEEVTSPAQVDEFTFDEDVQQAIYSARKVPSLSRRVDRMVRELRAGRITDQEFISEVADWSDYLKAVREGKVYRKQTRGRARGGDYIRQRLLEAKRRGDITEQAADFAEWFIQRNPALVDELGISMRKPKVEGRYTGTYDPLRRLMTLMKGAASDSTAVHEMMHHFERMMPEDIQEAIRTSWKKAFVKASKKAQTQQEKDYFAALDAFHSGKSITDGSGKQLPPSAGYDIAMEIGAKLPYDFYQYMNPSEFWAVNATDIMQGRYDVQGSTLGRLKGWLRDLGQKIKGLFGLPSKAPILKALDSLSNADGRFQSLGMLQNANVKLGDVAPEPATEPTAPAPSEILTPEEEALRITSEAATEPAADSMETIKEAAQPSIRLYNIRSELQEKNRGCD